MTSEVDITLRPQSPYLGFSPKIKGKFPLPSPKEEKEVGSKPVLEGEREELPSYINVHILRRHESGVGNYTEFRPGLNPISVIREVWMRGQVCGCPDSRNRVRLSLRFRDYVGYDGLEICHWVRVVAEHREGGWSLTTAFPFIPRPPHCSTTTTQEAFAAA